MAEGEPTWGTAAKQATRFLRRYHDPWTRQQRDDLVQEATIAAWRWSDRVHDPRRFWAAVRTIVGRLRMRHRFLDRRRLLAQGVAAREAGDEGHEPERTIVIGGVRLPMATATALLRAAMQRLPEIDRELLRAFHEGFCCAELELRFGLTEPCIKTRIHRARRRLEKEIEASVRAAGDLDVT